MRPQMMGERSERATTTNKRTINKRSNKSKIVEGREREIVS